MPGLDHVDVNVIVDVNAHRWTGQKRGTVVHGPSKFSPCPVLERKRILFHLPYTHFFSILYSFSTIVFCFVPLLLIPIRAGSTIQYLQLLSWQRV